jgi:hypothetical protein
MTTTTIEEVKQEKFELPKWGVYKDKDGKTVYGILPYEFKFQGKEEYLAWKNLWKESYKELSKNIREQKAIRNTHGHDQQSSAAYEAARLRVHARAHMEILEQGKKLSYEQKLANKTL